jgi:hypothetical protein
MLMQNTSRIWVGFGGFLPGKVFYDSKNILDVPAAEFSCSV